MSEKIKYLLVDLVSVSPSYVRSQVHLAIELFGTISANVFN
jgi:hypothetical protein